MMKPITTKPQAPKPIVTRPAPIWPLTQAEENLKRVLREDNRTHLKRMFG